MENYQNQVAKLQEEKVAIEGLKKKITKKAITLYVKKQLSTNTKWALAGLKTIYSYQTADEQAMGDTVKLNGVGFTGTDGGILSSFAQQYIQRGTLSPKQMAIVMKKMKKYHSQIIMSSDTEKLKLMVAKSLGMEVEEEKKVISPIMLKAMKYI